MEGYEVITSDEQDLGHVVEVKGDILILEHGLLRKTRHAVPKVFADADTSRQVVRLSVSSELVEASPKLEDGSVDERAVAQHYGLAAGEPAPETQGYGELTPDDPALSAEQEELRTGVEPPRGAHAFGKARARRGLTGGRSSPPIRTKAPRDLSPAQPRCLYERGSSGRKPALASDARIASRSVRSSSQARFT